MTTAIRSLKIITIVIFAGFVSFIVFSTERVSPTAIASTSGPPAGRTGAPGESTCTSCHASNPQTGQFSIVVPTNYVPGQTYSIQVHNSTTDMSRSSWGFELTSLTGSNTAAGTFANVNATTRIRTANSKSYIEQAAAGVFPGQTGSSSWTFNWTAPATNVGPVTFYAAGLHGDNQDDDNGDQTYTTNAVSQPATPVIIRHGFSDFDGDGKADASVFRQSTGTWYLNQTTNGVGAIQWGISTDDITPADFDGDDKADIAVWRPDDPTVAAFYILQSSSTTVRIERFGQTGDDPAVVGDWDGDGKADPAVFRAPVGGGQSSFYFRGSLNNPGGDVTYLPWGLSGDIPMPGDFDGDGKRDRAVFRTSTSEWYILQSSNLQIRYDFWGLPTDRFVNADYDGDSKTDLAVFRNGTWYIKQSSNGQAVYLNWGLSTDIPVPADYDGDGKTDVAIYRNGVWYILRTSSGTMGVQSFGLGTDKPVPNAFVQ